MAATCVELSEKSERKKKKGVPSPFACLLFLFQYAFCLFLFLMHPSTTIKSDVLNKAMTTIRFRFNKRDFVFFFNEL